MNSTAFALSVGAITFVISVIWGEPAILLLKRLTRWPVDGRTFSPYTPESDDPQIGAFAPLMGGILIVLPVAVVTVGLNAAGVIGREVMGRSTLIPLGVLLLFGAIGGLDDWETMRGIRDEGMSPRLKLVAQLVCALIIALILHLVLGLQSIALPGIERKFDIGTLYIPLAMVIIFAMANGIDLHDGVDGLAGITSVMAFAAYGIIALLQEQVYLFQFCLTMVGATVAFLWFNIHPSKIDLGDGGSLALGATLGVVALMTGQWLILPVIALLPVVESLSILIQVLYYYGSRFMGGSGDLLFKDVPLHRHFLKAGWSDAQVFQRFWIVEILAITIGVALALL